MMGRMPKRAPVSADDVFATLGKQFDPPRTFLDFKNPLELLVATILSAQCTDARVNIVTKALFAKYKTPQDYLNADPEELQRDIHSCGHFRNKAKYIQASCGMLLDKWNGEVPGTMEELTQMPGVGRKTATVLLYAVFHKEEGIAVDTHVWRVSRRLGLTARNTQDKIELDLMRQVPRVNWGRMHTLLIMLGRNICVARGRKCEICPFQQECPSSKMLGYEDLAGVGTKGKSVKKGK
jgi:endonuclease-3